jgi:zinc D-Ala-D-Ala carboxypeptidase
VSIFRTVLANASAFVFASTTLLTPAQATSTVATDYCASIMTSQIHLITAGKCADGERSLGAGQLRLPPQRPKHLNSQLMARFITARNVGASHGYTIEIRSGWRSVLHQQRLFDAAVKKYGSEQTATKWVLPPQDSMHTWGLAMDIKYSGNIESSAFWFQKYSSHFGLCRRYRNEWWHYEPLVSPGQACPDLKASPTSSLRSKE